MSKEYRVNVYEDEEVIGRVRYNANLDYWNGSNWTNGSTGRHMGLTKLQDGRYVLIHGTQWQGEKDSAEIVSADEALQEIMRTQSLRLLDTKKFRGLKKLYEEKYANIEDLDEDK